jgi:hypothetical protein
MLLIGIIFSIVGSAVAIPLDWGLPGELALTLAHREVTAEVVSTSIDYNVRVNGQHPTRIHYRYRDNDVAYDGDSATRDRARIAAAVPGAPITVEVARWHPAWSRIAGGSYSLMGLWGLLMLIMPALGITLTFFAVRSNRREIRAFEEGTPILARVSFAGPDTSTTINGRHPHKLVWEFQVDGEVYSGSISCMSLLLIEDLMQKKEIPVLYDPLAPKVNTVWVP